MKMMLIEDEFLAMEELRHLMKPYESEHTIVSFDNGEEALDCARLSPPDIVISDIRMPGMDGLGVVEKLIALHPRTQAVMLSGYNDFEYARTALKVGAREYLLKPVTALELYAAVDRMVATVCKEEEKSRIELNWSLSRMVRGLMEGDTGGSQEEMDGEWLMIAVLLENWNSSLTWQQTGLPLTSIAAWLRSELHPKANCFDMDLNIRIVLLPVTETELESTLRHQSSRVHNFFHQGKMVVHSVYGLKTKRSSLEETYRHCLRLLDSQVRLGEATFMPIEKPPSAQSFWDCARRIEHHIRDTDYAKLQLELRRMLESMRREGTTLRQVAVLLSDFFYALKYKLDNQMATDGVGADSIYDYLKTCRDDSRLLEWLSEKLMAWMAGKDQSVVEPKKIIPSLMDYAQQHYGETVQLQDFASRHHVSVGYLSKLFKSETGYNFSDYIIRIRMNKAQELLDGGYTKIADISRLVGYEDPKFFSQTFKRWIGFTPQDYKRKPK